jgi:hypothetical protein
MGSRNQDGLADCPSVAIELLFEWELLIGRAPDRRVVVTGLSCSSIVIRLQVDVTSESEGRSITAPEG